MSVSSAHRSLRGGCHCGRNRYTITVPPDGLQDAQVLFSTESSHQVPLATLLAAYLRVPLSWYQSTTYAFLPDETHSMIRRIYTHPSQDRARRHFCGYCGTPLSYWSEDSTNEPEYINLTLGSLLPEDLRDLEDMGLVSQGRDGDRDSDEPLESDTPESDAPDNASPAPSNQPTTTWSSVRQSFGVPWFDGLVEGTRLGKMRRSHGIQRSQDGQAQVEWEVVEYNADGDEETEDIDTEMETPSSGSTKRKLEDLNAA